MTLIEDAKRLADSGFTPWATRLLDEALDELICELCHATVTTSPVPNQWTGHAPGCPWLSLPRIVSALTAAEAMATAHEQQSYPGYWSAMQRAVQQYRAALAKPPGGKDR